MVVPIEHSDESRPRREAETVPQAPPDSGLAELHRQVDELSETIRAHLRSLRGGA